MSSLANLFILLFMSIPVTAIAANWQIIPKDSSLTFTATQNDAPVNGEFKSFSGNIAFDADKLNQSDVKIIVDIASLTTSYNDMTETLRTSDWFDTTKFPQAIFTAKNFKKSGDNQYEAIGTLTIRDKSSPVTLTFKGDDFTKPEVNIEGNTNINRSTFGVGQGEWSSTDEIKDTVKVNFKLKARKY